MPVPRRLRARLPASALLLGAAWLLLAGTAPSGACFVPASGALSVGPAAWLAALSPVAIAAPALADSGDVQLASAFVAYGHYFALLLLTGLIVVERVLIKPNMSRDEEMTFLYADSAIGVASILLVATGYLRATQYGKGWDFYQHEPIFWLKMVLLCVYGAASFFVTTIVVKRTVAVNQGGDGAVKPVSQKLADRVTSILNAELLAMASVPLAATLMARGVGYADWFPWQSGAASAALVLFGLGGKYIKEALDWTEDDAPDAASVRA